jgi:hypothetical protein
MCVSRPSDREVEQALNRFITATGCAGVRVSFDSGHAQLSGAVARASHRTALEDLVGAHDAVRSVRSDVSVIAVAALAAFGER